MNIHYIMLANWRGTYEVTVFGGRSSGTGGISDSAGDTGNGQTGNVTNRTGIVVDSE